MNNDAELKWFWKDKNAGFYFGIQYSWKNKKWVPWSYDSPVYRIAREPVWIHPDQNSVSPVINTLVFCMTQHLLVGCSCKGSPVLIPAEQGCWAAPLNFCGGSIWVLEAPATATSATNLNNVKKFIYFCKKKIPQWRKVQ